MSIGDSLISFNNFFIAQVVVPSTDYNCVLGGLCTEKEDKIEAFTAAVQKIINYFLLNPEDGGAFIYDEVFKICQLIAGFGALWFLVPYIVDYSRQNYSTNLNKVFLLFMLMLLFANQGYLGKYIALGNYYTIQGVHKGIKDVVDNNETWQKIATGFNNEEQATMKVVRTMSTCSQIPETTLKKDADGGYMANEAFTKCRVALEGFIRDYLDKYPSTLAAPDFRKALNEKEFVDMAIDIQNATVGLAGTSINLKKGTDGKLAIDGSGTEIKNLLVGWRGAIAMVPELALVAGLLFYPFPLAIAFFNTSYLQSWFVSMWSVGLFKFMMTILSNAFIVIQKELMGQMPLDTVDLVLGIVIPSISIALATGSGLGLSTLVSQGVSTLSSKLSGSQQSINDRTNLANQGR